MSRARLLVSFSLSRRGWAVLTIMSVSLLWALVASFFAVDVKEYGVVTRFGSVVRLVPEPGLHVKAPFDRVVRLDKRLTFTRPAPAEYLTVDKRNVVVESLATWHITEPGRFLATLATRANADLPLADVISGEIGAVLGRYPATSLIAPDGNTQRFRAVVSEIRERVARFAQAAYGIEIVDVELLHLTLPEQNREHVFDRMKAERGKMAKEYRTFGQFQARRIVAEADRERTRIEAESYSQAQRLRAEGDAEAARVYAAAFGQNPGFYKFLRTLQAYEKFLDESTTLFLPADAEVMRMLRPPPRSSAPVERESSAAVTAAPSERSQPASAARPARPGAGSAPAEHLTRRANQAQQ